MFYCVLTADVNRSRDIQDRAALQEQIQKAIHAVNRSFESNLVVPFTITIGDEWQGVLKSISKSYTAVLDFQIWFEGISVSFGIGEGEILTPLAARSAEMDGEAFHRSRRALEEAKLKNREVIFSTSDENIDRLLNALTSTLQLVRSRWTKRQRQKIELYKHLRNERRVAEKLKVSQADINQTLSSTGARIFLECENELVSFLKTRDLLHK